MPVYLLISAFEALPNNTGEVFVDDETLLNVPCEKVDTVLIFGNVLFTTQAVHEMFDHGIEMAILTRTGRLVGQITSPPQARMLHSGWRNLTDTVTGISDSISPGRSFKAR